MREIYKLQSKKIMSQQINKTNQSTIKQKSTTSQTKLDKQFVKNRPKI